MIYAIIIWSMLVLSTGLMVYESLYIKHASLVYHQKRIVIDELMIRVHAKLLLILVVLWSVACLIINRLHIQYTTIKPDLVLYVLIVGILTPIFTYTICYAKCRMSSPNHAKCSNACLRIGFSLNVLTAFIYASFISIAIQILLFV